MNSTSCRTLIERRPSTTGPAGVDLRERIEQSLDRRSRCQQLIDHDSRSNQLSAPGDERVTKQPFGDGPPVPGQRNEARAARSRIVAELDRALRSEFVDDTLGVLTGEPQTLSDLWGRVHPVEKHAQDVPTRGRRSVPPRKGVAGRPQRADEVVDVGDEQPRRSDPATSEYRRATSTVPISCLEQRETGRFSAQRRSRADGPEWTSEQEKHRLIR